MTRNAVESALFESIDYFKEKEKRFVYASPPDRGLDILVKIIWPGLKNFFSDFRLSVYSGMSVYQMSKEQEESNFGGLYNIIRSDKSIDFIGNIPQPELIKELSRHYLMLYPNTVSETACIVAMESMYAGTPVIASNCGALPETVEDGGKIIYEPIGSQEYYIKYIQTCVELFDNPLKYNEIRKKGIEKIRSKNLWINIASEWEEIFKLLLNL